MVDENLYLFTGTAEIFIQNRISRIISSYDKQQISIIKYDMEQTSFSRVLEEFPVSELGFKLPSWFVEISYSLPS